MKTLWAWYENSTRLGKNSAGALALALMKHQNEDLMQSYTRDAETME